MRQISKKEFYDVIGDMDVVVSAVGNYPYRSEFRNRSGGLVGYSQDFYLDIEESEIATVYFLSDVLCPANTIGVKDVK